MNQNKLFQQTRLRLALWYALVMALILSLCGFGIYRAISHAHWMTLDRELKLLYICGKLVEKLSYFSTR